MEAKEIRIGNYLLFLGREVEVQGIYSLPDRPDMYWIKVPEYIESKIIHFKGIPLDSFTIARLGFKSFGNNYSLDGIVVNTRKRGFIINKDVPPMEYVHQLQNYFYARRGYDLTYTV